MEARGVCRDADQLGDMGLHVEELDERLRDEI
jgi:hypothetical protein